MCMFEGRSNSSSGEQQKNIVVVVQGGTGPVCWYTKYRTILSSSAEFNNRMNGRMEFKMLLLLHYILTASHRLRRRGPELLLQVNVKFIHRRRD